jgi:hypothetical protein
MNKLNLTTSAEFSATIAFAFVGGVAISGAKLVLPTLRSVYYGYAHHTSSCFALVPFLFIIIITCHCRACGILYAA